MEIDWAKTFSEDFFVCLANCPLCTKNNTLLKPSSRIANAEANVLPVPEFVVKGRIKSLYVFYIVNYPNNASIATIAATTDIIVATIELIKPIRVYLISESICRYEKFS